MICHFLDPMIPRITDQTSEPDFITLRLATEGNWDLVYVLLQAKNESLPAVVRMSNLTEKITFDDLTPSKDYMVFLEVVYCALSTNGTFAIRTREYIVFISACSLVSVFERSGIAESTVYSKGS